MRSMRATKCSRVGAMPSLAQRLVSASVWFGVCSLFKVSALDCVLVFESMLDSVRVFESVGLDSVFPKFSALDSESALDSVDSKFLRVVFSRILPRFSKSF